MLANARQEMENFIFVGSGSDESCLGEDGKMLASMCLWLYKE